MSNDLEDIFDYEAIKEFYSSVLKNILPNARHKRLGYFGAPTNKALAINLDLADSNSINKDSKYFYTGAYKFIHYTSVQNAINIIRSKKIRLYNLNGMDDREEFVTSSKYLNLNLSDNQTEKIKQKIFCFSMCEAGVEAGKGSLSMWRQYAQDGAGIGLVFSLNKNKAPIWVNYMLSKLYYGENHLEAFKKAFIAYREFRTRKNLLIRTFDELFYKYYSFHKNAIYSHEKEVRLLHNCGFKDYYQPTVFEDINRNLDKTAYIELPLEWQWPEEKKQFIESQGFKPIDVNPIIKIEKIVLGYRINPQKKSNITKVLAELLRDYDHHPKIEDSSLTPFFKG